MEWTSLCEWRREEGQGEGEETLQVAAYSIQA